MIPYLIGHPILDLDATQEIPACDTLVTPLAKEKNAFVFGVREHKD
jgi:hypothetical protein